MSLYDYLGIKFWFEVVATIIGLTVFAIWLIYNWWHDRLFMKGVKNMNEKDLIRNLNKILDRPDFTNALKVDTCKTLLSSYEGVKDDKWIS